MSTPLLEELLAGLTVGTLQEALKIMGLQPVYRLDTQKLWDWRKDRRPPDAIFNSLLVPADSGEPLTVALFEGVIEFVPQLKRVNLLSILMRLAPVGTSSLLLSAPDVSNLRTLVSRAAEAGGEVEELARAAFPAVGLPLGTPVQTQ